MPNPYSTLDDLKTRLSITATANDATLLTLLEVASRSIDDDTQRFFFTETKTRVFDTHAFAELLVDEDLLSVTTFTTDSELDGTLDGETWTEGTDFILRPDNDFPKYEIYVPDYGNYSFLIEPRYVQIVGVWGYGDAQSATPWATTAITGTVADASTTTVDVSAESTIQAGHTILAGTEQMYVSAATTDASKEITVERGVNGTTAAAQAAAVLSTAKYPALIAQEALTRATADWRQVGDEVFMSEMLADYRYQRFAPDAQRKNELRRTSSYRRMLAP